MITGSRRFRGLAQDERIELSIGEDEQRFYSPQLIVRVRAEGEGSVLEGRFGPDPYVWAFYVLFAGGLAALTFFAGMVGIGQALTGQSPTALWIAPLAAIAAALAYGASFVGQGLAIEQLYLLRHALEHAAEAREPE